MTVEEQRKDLYWSTIGCDNDLIVEVAHDEYKMQDFTGFTDEEVERWESEDAAIEDNLRNWLDTHDATDPEYSDIFKDVYGYRPR